MVCTSNHRHQSIIDQVQGSPETVETFVLRILFRPLYYSRGFSARGRAAAQRGVLLTGCRLHAVTSLLPPGAMWLR
jgi:hypothetical protein